MKSQQKSFLRSAGAPSAALLSRIWPQAESTLVAPIPGQNQSTARTTRVRHRADVPSGALRFHILGRGLGSPDPQQCYLTLETGPFFEHRAFFLSVTLCIRFCLLAHDRFEMACLRRVRDHADGLH